MGNSNLRTLSQRDQFKCRSCRKNQSCYGSRYCQNEYNPVSIVTGNGIKKARNNFS
jgi:hypothetical protein